MLYMAVNTSNSSHDPSISCSMGEKRLMYEQLRWARRKQAYTEEAWQMELLANEEDDEERILDNGELEGSSDDFEQ